MEDYKALKKILSDLDNANYFAQEYPELIERISTREDKNTLYSGLLVSLMEKLTKILDETVKEVKRVNPDYKEENPS